MYTKDDLDKDLIGPLTEQGSPPPQATVDDDPFAVPGLQAPSWWRGDEEASISGVMVR